MDHFGPRRLRRTLAGYLEANPLSGRLLATWRRRRGEREVRKWQARGRPAPPPHQHKVAVVRSYAWAFGLCAFVETGTLYGDMVVGVEDLFDVVHTIELSPRLLKLARRRLKRLGDRVWVHGGDSASVLPRILDDLRCDCLFWLDAHYSGGETAKGDRDTPIERELDAIALRATPGSVVLIDDSRCFNGEGGYPRLVDLVASLGGRFPWRDVSVRDDIIRIVPHGDLRGLA